MSNRKRILHILWHDTLDPIDQVSDIGIWNTGNMVFQNAVTSFFYGLDNYTPMLLRHVWENIGRDPEFAIKNFDIVVTQLANGFSETFHTGLVSMSDLFLKLKIPVYVLGIGIQGQFNYETDFFKRIKDNSSKFIEAILQGGGDITLRGEFTKHFCEYLGFKDLFVSGCPSFFYKGGKEIIKKHISPETFAPFFCPNTLWDIPEKVVNLYPRSILFDQVHYLDVLYNKNFDAARLFQLYNNDRLWKYLNDNRIRGYLNYYPWSESVKRAGNFSYGQRLHGSIVALQCGTPAFVDIIDARVREICEFFSIPNSIETPFNIKLDCLYDLYRNVNYDKYNSLLRKRCGDFYEFLRNHQIPHIEGVNHRFDEMLARNYQSYINIDARTRKNIKRYVKCRKYLSISYKIAKTIASIHWNKTKRVKIKSYLNNKMARIILGGDIV